MYLDNTCLLIRLLRAYYQISDNEVFFKKNQQFITQSVQTDCGSYFVTILHMSKQHVKEKKEKKNRRKRKKDKKTNVITITQAKATLLYAAFSKREYILVKLQKKHKVTNDISLWIPIIVESSILIKNIVFCLNQINLI